MGAAPIMGQRTEKEQRPRLLSVNMTVSTALFTVGALALLGGMVIGSEQAGSTNGSSCVDSPRYSSEVPQPHQPNPSASNQGQPREGQSAPL